jgi:hypothetical protein
MIMTEPSKRNLLLVLGQYWAERQAEASPTSPVRSRWLPTPGNVLFTCLALALLLLTQGVWATNNPNTTTMPGPNATTVNYQGRLAAADGTPQNGTFGMSFTIYDATSGGSIVWGPENHSAIPVTDGLFNVGLGSLTSGGIPTNVWGGDRYLEITVGGETLFPRELIRSVPIAGMALTVPQGSITSGNLNLNHGTTCLSSNRDVSSPGSNQVITVSNFSLPFSLSQSSRVLIWYDGLARFNVPPDHARVFLTVNGEEKTGSYGDNPNRWFPLKGQRIISLDSGNHALGLAINSQQAGTMTLNGNGAFQTCINYLVLGE